MTLTRPRATSLRIPIPAAPWRAARPPTPRRATFPLPGTTATSPFRLTSPNAPPIPPLSYWDPDTPSPQAVLQSPTSPTNPFLTPPTPRFNPHALFPMASPLLPASPLSIFDRTISPTQSTLLKARSRLPSLALHPVTPMTPRFLFPRTPPCPPFVVERKRSVVELVRVERERMRVEFYYFIAARRGLDMECEEKTVRWAQRPWRRTFGGGKSEGEGERDKVAVRKRWFQLLRDVVVCG
ncbi:hypothetical protein P153DRAFT_409615 [Dothidotthia symphoricarpi CBS 119687]|uniref:Uncharacterized protein n=1 Tax=Dothidotthia symphoricarpi CBS 119687 TaxID=1392245 RepID=A0A6A6AUG9_9PLEO|nr:uncharacterized protein P153DRAFT_409615 [Dothidotthia symphoricarpi CBS 119687]KAF2134181.1 hypothetical protein P153DRAFT_409615 [Dothidotthia symphoricarpi CBS 119687]